MAKEIRSPNKTGATTRTLKVEGETGRLLDTAAIQKDHPVALVSEDPVQLYIRSRSEGYQAHLKVVGGFLEAPSESDEQALAGAELARERGQELPLEHGSTPVPCGG